MTDYPALAWYVKLLSVAPRRKDATIPQLVQYAQRAASLSSTERAAILADLAAFQAGDVACPTCGRGGGHTTNNHHRFYKLAFTCPCGATFKSTEVT